MENRNENTKHTENKWIGIVITQSVCILIILISLLLIKYFSADTFSSIKKWYENNICNDTDVNEVLLSDEI